MENKYGVYKIMDLMVYDKDGSFITKLNTLKNSAISIDTNGEAYLIAKDALMDIDLLRFVYGDRYKNLSDFDSFINHITNKKITFNNKKLTKPCKLISTSVLRNAYNGKDEIAYYEIQKAEIVSPFYYGSDDGINPSIFDLHFHIEPNANGDLLHLHI